jgi:hypothetical protein
MKRFSALFCVVVFMVFAFTQAAQAQGTPTPPATAPATRPATPATPPAKEVFHIYLLMGQSNMVGRDTIPVAAQVDDPRILALSPEGQWVMAREPMYTGGSGMGPGIYFAKEMLKTDPKITIGLVQSAVGGTPLRRWVKGGDLYEKAVERAKLAAPFGQIKGVLWHQGESDTNTEENAGTYEARLSQMLKDLRQDLSMPNLPIVVGQLGEFLSAEKYPQVKTVRAAIAHIPAIVPNTGFADSIGLGHKGDILHFSADAQAEFGVRYAKVMQQLQKN